MSRNDRVETVRFTGGQHHGLVVQAPPHIAERLHSMKFEVLATGQLYDLARQQRIPHTRAITPAPAPAPVAAAAVPEPATSAPELPILDRTPAPAPTTRPAPAMPVFQPARPT